MEAIVEEPAGGGGGISNKILMGKGHQYTRKIMGKGKGHQYNSLHARQRSSIQQLRY